jgi:hypothetical protein
MKIVGLLILSLAAFWLLGGVMLRLGGLFVIFLVLFGLASGAADEVPAGAPYAVGWLVVGALMWLAGHWHYALRHGQPKSSLADSLFVSLPSWLDPLHRHRPARAGAKDVLPQDPPADPAAPPLLDGHLEHDVYGRTVLPDEEQEPRRGMWQVWPQDASRPWGRRRGAH